MDSEVTSGWHGFELKSTSLKGVCLDADSQIKTTYERSFDAEGDHLAQIVSFLEDSEAELGSFEYAGLAVPGLVDTTSNRIVYSAKNPTVVAARDISTAIGKKIVLENDANAAAYAEMVSGAGVDCKDMFYVKTGAGIGGALILDRRLWHGTSGFAGEFGFMAIDENGTRLEEVASANGIVERAKSRLHLDTASSLFEVGEDDLTFEDVLAAAKEDDGFAELIFERTGSFLGMAIANVINLLNVERIVVGGVLTEVGEMLMEPLRDRATQFSFKDSFGEETIVQGKLGPDAGCIGAALIVKERTQG